MYVRYNYNTLCCFDLNHESPKDLIKLYMTKKKIVIMDIGYIKVTVSVEFLLLCVSGEEDA